MVFNVLSTQKKILKAHLDYYSQLMCYAVFLLVIIFILF